MLKAQNKEQRVGVFVDVQNMYYTARHLYKARVNFTNLLKTAVAGRKLVRAFAYVIQSEEDKDKQSFFDALELIGFELKIKPLQTFYGGAKKGDWDVGIAKDIIRMSTKLDVVVLISGDGDFKELIEYVQSHGCRGEVMAFGPSTSSKLKDQADQFIDLDKDHKRYTLQESAGHPKEHKAQAAQ